jgi:hypothetical protein
MLKVSDIPPNLTYLSLDVLSLFDTEHIDFDKPFPPGIKSLLLTQQLTREELQAFCPIGVTRLSLPYTDSGLCDLFPNLAELNLVQRGIGPQNVCLPSLRKLTTCEPLTEQSPLPPNLTDLRTVLPTPDLFHSWPIQHLTVLHLAMNLPSAPAFDTSAWQTVWPFLTDLNAPLESFEGPDVIRGFARLKALKLILPFSRLPRHSESFGQPFLPPSLTRIELQHKYDQIGAFSYSHLLNHLKQCMDLKTLHLNKVGIELQLTAAINEREAYIDSDSLHPFRPTITEHPFLSSLPPSITELSMVLLGTFEETCLRHLPPNLRILSVRSIGRLGSFLTNNHFSVLPASLTSLTIDGPCGVNLGIYNVIPPSLYIMHFSSRWENIDLWAEAKKRYFQTPRWAGMVPEDNLSSL